jgi:hypothetical protein
MPHWSNRPPPDPRGHALPITRTPVGRKLTGISTAENLIGCDTHWYHGRTTPCERPDCEACLNAIPFRWHSYVSLWDPRRALHFLLELTAQASDPLVTYHKAHDTLRGALLTCWRIAPRPNARVVVQVTEWAGNPEHLPPSPDLPAALAILWNLPTPNVSQTAVHNDKPAASVTSVETRPAPTPRHKEFHDANHPT